MERAEIIAKIKAATARPTIADAALEPLKEKIYEVVDEKVKPKLLHPGDISGKKYLFVDPRLNQKDLW